MREKVFSYLEQWNMVSPGEIILAGFSGGADSTALLYLLKEYGQKHKVEIRAVHVNHGIRGEEALRDQLFCVQVCDKLGIPLTVVRKDVPSLAKEWGISTEEAGRRVRYEVFEQILAKGEADAVALAHHQNDQAETMLFHLMRGSGLKGLRGMKPVRGSYIRPLLCVSRQEIEDWLKMRGIAWVEDGTNQEQDYTRNQIRHQVLAPMERIRPGSIRHMAGSAERLQELEDYLEGRIAADMEETVNILDDYCEIILEKLEQKHPYMQKELVIRCLEALYQGSWHPEEVHIRHILELTQRGRGSRCLLPEGFYAVLGYETLQIKKENREKKKEGEYLCPVNGTCRYMGKTFSFVLENWKKNEKIPLNCYTKWFDYDKIKRNVVLRTRQPGDYLEVSKGAHRKLKDYLIDSKVPREERDDLILLADGRSIIWVVGMRISETYKITEETTRVLKVQMTEDGGI